MGINAICDGVANWIHGKLGVGAAWAAHGLIHGATIAALPVAMVLLLFAMFGFKKAAKGVWVTIAVAIVVNMLGVTF